MRTLVIVSGMVLGALVVLGQSQAPAPASPQAQTQGEHKVDPSEEADIRSLIELIGANDAIEDATTNAIEQFRVNLVEALPDSDRARKFENAFLEKYKARFNADQVMDQLVLIYDKHFGEDDIKGMLQFYGTPLGQKLAQEMPMVTRETQAATGQLSRKVAREVLQELGSEYPDFTSDAKSHPNLRRRRNGTPR